MASRGFVTISDSAYYPGVVALINSIRRHHDLPVTVIDEGLTEPQRRALATADVTVVRVVRSIPVNSTRFGCCYAIFDIDAAPADIIVCIDPDAIVLAPLDDVFESAQHHGFVATAANGAGQLLRPGYRQKFSKSLPRGEMLRARFLLQFPRYLPYVFGRMGRPMSSGVVGVRRDLMPAIRNAAARYRRYFHALRWPDQDLLSYCMLDMRLDWHALPYEYNAARLHEPANVHAQSAYDGAVRKAMNENVSTHVSRSGVRITSHVAGCIASSGLDIKVLHYAGPLKPWRDEPLREGFRELWQRCYNSSQLLAKPDLRESPGTAMTA